MSEDPPSQPPVWWQFDRRAARDAARQTRREERAAKRAERHGAAPATPSHEPITPERIADAALAIIDAEGPDGLTVRALAGALGLGTMTLYWYIRNKEEVLDLVADRMFAGVQLPPLDADWRVSTREAGVAIRRLFLAHARAVPIVASRGSFGPNGLRLVEGSLAIYRAAGFSDTDAADAYFTISNYVTGFCLFETVGVGGGPEGAFDRQAYAARARGYISLLSPERYPNIAATAERMFGGNRDDRYLFGLECLIAGLEARLAATRARSDTQQ